MKKGVILMMAASLSVTMSSCGLYSKYEPQSEVDETLFGEVGEFSSEAEANKATYGDMMWSDIFTDPLLQGYIEQALANNSDLRSAELRVEQAEASMISSRLAYLPSLSLAPSWSTGGVVSTSDYNYKSYTVPFGEVLAQG
ncbi:MAG: TolC family protein, partial [Rikenellaceae bacterium]